MAKKQINPDGTLGAPAATSEIDTLKAENQAMRTQNDQVLDALIEMREEMQALKAERGIAPAPVVDEQARLEAELAALREEFADVPNIDVIARRIEHGTDAPSGIRLKAAPGGIPEPTVAEDPHGETCYWKLRWFNFAIEGRAERFVGEGYLKVEKSELADPDSIPNLSAIDHFVRKGERGQEVLGKIPRRLFEYKKRRDALRNGRMLTSEAALKDHVSNRVASLAGNSGGNADQAGSTVHGKFDLTITQGEKESVTF